MAALRTAVGFSGGVDSLAATLLLRESGDEVVPVTMTLGRDDEDANLAAAREAAAALGLRLEVIDLSAAWREHVVGYLREAYRAGLTPNPCVRCNERVKFSLLPHFAFDVLGCDRFATGHYARVERSSDGGVRLLKGTDRAKDQSYFLYAVSREVLARTVFPIGGMTKRAVREMVRAAGFAAADRPDSEDFCGGDVRRLVGADDRPGEIVDESGHVLGRHSGHWHYTVGMRKGLGLGGGGTPLYVTRIDAATNRIAVGSRAAALVKRFAFDPAMPVAGEGLYVKVRSAGEPKGPVSVTADGICTAPDGIFGVAPGQNAVFYRGDEVVGGGVIRRSADVI